jgi:toluene monooxygenase electron transfer component
MKVEVKARNRALQFSAEATESVLYAGLRHALKLPYECATGTCGTCKAKLVSGEIQDLWPDAPGKKNLKLERGEFLMCQCAPRGDLSVEVGAFLSEMDPGAVVPSNFTGTIRNSRMLTHDVMSFEVDLDERRDFDAGQFVAVRFPGVQGYRGYSMVNYKRRAETLEFVVKKVPGGRLTEKLFGEAPDGTDVEMFGPLGVATFYPALDKNLLCIAGGSGIAGIMSILSRASQENYFKNHHGHVFFGVRTSKDLFYAKELEALKAGAPGSLHIVIALSHEESAPTEFQRMHPTLEFDTGWVHEVAGRRMKGAYDNVIAYLAGPPPAVDASIRMLLLEARLTTDSIRYDKFS